MITLYEKKTADNKDIFYEILDDGFKIYIAQQVRPTIHQYEPYIPDPSKSYEENAKEMCEDFCKEIPEPEPVFTMTESMYTEMQSNIDYLMLLNDTTDE